MEDLIEGIDNAFQQGNQLDSVNSIIPTLSSVFYPSGTEPAKNPYTWRKDFEFLKKYKSLSIFILVCSLTLLLKDHLLLFLSSINSIVVLAFLSGCFYSYSCTVPISLLLFHLFYGNLLILAIIASLGSMLADYVIFRFIKDNLLSDLKLFLTDWFGCDAGKLTSRIYRFIEGSRFGRRIILPMIICLIISSPLPDEVGVGLAASYKMNENIFIPISFLFNFIGIAGILGVVNGL